MKLGHWVVLAVALAACSSNTTIPPDSLSDVQQRSDATPDIEQEIAADDTTDTADHPELLTPDTTTTPDPNKVSEELDHPNCLPDGPYLVHRSEQVRTEVELPFLDVWAVLTLGDNLLAGTDGGLFVRAAGSELFSQVTLPFDACKVRSLSATAAGGVVVGGLINDSDSYFAFELNGELEGDDGAAGTGDAESGEKVAVFQCDGEVYLVHAGNLGVISYFTVPPKSGVADAACVDNEPWIVGPTGASRLVGGPYEGEWQPICGPESCGDLKTIAGGSKAFAAGGVRVAELASTGVQQEWLAGLSGLPYDRYTALAPSPDGSKLAIGHEIGVTILHLESGETDYFHSKRWLPGEEVRDLSWDADGALWVATNAGLARLWNEEIYLRDKADLLLTKMEDWFFRLDGFLTAGAQFDDPWEDDSAFLWDDDNDGQWTEEGIGAMCYAYAVTGEERYYLAARRCVENMMLLIDIPAVSFEEVGINRGFISRSVVRDDETACFADKVTQNNWHLVHWTDGHDYYWKDDTSSDELTGHFYGLPIYYDLCAKDDAERAEIAEHVEVAADYLLDNGYTLPDLDGEPTTHGDWTPARLTRAVDGLQVCMDNGNELVDCIDSWGGGAFLDSVEILSFMAAAWHVTGELRFLESFEYLAGPARVGETAMFTENVATWTGRGTTNYCDHELADLAFLALLRYDPNSERRQQWLDSLLAAWEWEKGERNPLKALSMAAFIAESEGLKEGVISLVEYPDDLRMWLVDNSHRLDADPDVNDRHGDPQFKTALPYDELPILRWDHNPYGMKGGNSGNNRMSPAFWLLPYWGLRYHGAICPD
jgi:hypothetical protein